MTEQDQAICANPTPKPDRAEILTNAALSLGWGVTRMTDEDKPSLMFEPTRASGKRAGIVAHIDKLDDDDTFAELLAFFHHGPPADNGDGDHAPHCIVGAIDRQTRAIERTARNHDLRDVNLALLGLGEKIVASEERQVDRVAGMFEKVMEIASNTVLAGIKADREERAERRAEEEREERAERRAEEERNKQAERERVERAEQLFAKREPCAPLAVLDADRHKYPCLVALDKTDENKAMIASMMLRLGNLEKTLANIEGDCEEGTNPATQSDLTVLRADINSLKRDIRNINNDRP